VKQVFDFDSDLGDIGEVYDAEGKPLYRAIKGTLRTGVVLCSEDRAGVLVRSWFRFKAPLRLENYRRGDGWAKG